MSSFPVHSMDTAPGAAKPVLEATQQAFGFVPNLLGVMSSSPALAEAYLTISGLFDKTALSPVEKQVVLLTVSHFHECRYCMAAHSAIAAMQQLPEDVVAAIRNDEVIADAKLQALRTLVLQLVDQRGWVSESELQAFYTAGYEPSHVLDVLVGMAQKTMSNFTNHIAQTPLDQAFTEHAWTPEK